MFFITQLILFNNKDIIKLKKVKQNVYTIKNSNCIIQYPIKNTIRTLTYIISNIICLYPLTFINKLIEKKININNALYLKYIVPTMYLQFNNITQNIKKIFPRLTRNYYLTKKCIIKYIQN
jgi:hypothetical protein